MFHSRYDHQTEKETRGWNVSKSRTLCRSVASDSRVRDFTHHGLGLASTGSNQAYRTISTGQLSTLPHLHLRPIDEVVYLGPQGYLVLRGASRLDAFSGYPVRS